MYFRVLGPIEVRDGDRLVPIRRQKQLALLALMLVHAGEVVSSDRILDELWGEGAPPNVKGSLHNNISQLRRALGADTLLTRAPGYVLDVDADSVDLSLFERLAAEARDADNGRRAEKLREALALWRGPPFAELAFEPFIQPTIQRLEERRLVVLEERIDADLALRRHENLVGELEGLVAQHPLREHLRGQLMIALYRSGRQAEALEAYQDARRVLVDELGIEPSLAVRDLEQAILRQDPALAPTARDERTSSQPEPQEARKTATLLFAEIGPASADRAARVEEEALRRATIRASHELRVAVEYHGGTIERLAGDELMAVFGIPASHEDDVVRAARAAVQLRGALAMLSQTQSGDRTVEIAARTAIATGDVIVSTGLGRRDLSGDPMGLARRLAETALPGEILVDATSARRSGDMLRTDPAEPRMVRGQAEPIAVFRVLDVADDPSPRAKPRTPLIGRDVELSRLHALFERSKNERCCVVASIVGDAGIGKSRLAGAFAASIAHESSVVVGRCVSYGEGATYSPLAEIVAQLAGRHPREAIAELLAGEEDADVIAQRVTDLVGSADVETSTGEGFWAVRRLLERVARERPFVIVLEDLHWAEPTLLDLVEYLARWSRDAPILVLNLARPELLEARPAWAVETETVRVEALDEEAVSALVAMVGGDALQGKDRARITELAEGNPLYAEQLVAYAIEEGAERLQAVPPSLEALLSSRLDRLEPPALAVLQRAAVIGREFWHGAILHLSPPIEVPAVGRHLLELARKGLVDPADSTFPREDAFRFHHVLIRDVAYNSIPSETRAELHEKGSDWLDLQGADHDELVGYHLEQAYLCRIATGPPDRRARRLAADAGDRLSAAGMRAAKGGDTAAASKLLARAASLLPPDETTRRDVLAELGIAVWRTGDVEGAKNVLENAVATATSAHDRRAELRARLELANLTLFRSPEGGSDDFLSLAAAAIPTLEELGDDRALGRCWYSLAFVHGGLHCRYRESVEAAERASGYFRRSGWSVSPCLQELAAGLYYGPTTVPDAIRQCQVLRKNADRGGEANILAFLAGLEAMAGRIGTAREMVSRARLIYEELDWTVNASTNSATVAADVELLAENPAEAERLLTESCARLDDWGEQAHLATQAAQLGEAVYRQGRYEEASRWARVAETCAATDDAGAQFSSRALRAKVLARDGEFTEAETLARKAVAVAAETDALSQHANVLIDLGEVLRLDRRCGEAAAAVEDAIRLFDAKENVAASRRARVLLRELAMA